MVVWHLADVSLNPSVNALPGGGTLQDLTNGLGAWALIAALAGLLVGAAAWALGVHAQNFQQSHGRAASRAGVGAGRAADRRGAADHQLLLPHRHEPALTASTVRDVSMLAAGCTGLDALNPICQVGSLGGSIAASGFESVLNGISQWVASGAEWLLGQIGDVLVSTTTIDVGATLVPHALRPDDSAGRRRDPAAAAGLDAAGGAAPEPGAARAQLSRAAPARAAARRSWRSRS